MDQSGTKKYVKQVTGRHNDTELHLAAQRGDLAAVRQILGEIDAQMTGSAGGEEFDAEVAEIRSAVVNEVNEVEETPLMIAAERGFLDVVRELLKYSDRESVSRKNKLGFDVLHSAAKGGHRGEWRSQDSEIFHLFKIFLQGCNVEFRAGIEIVRIYLIALDLSFTTSSR